jgi:putative hemolysin
MPRVKILIGLSMLLLVAAACSKNSDSTTTSTTAGQSGLPNPASVYCVEQGGTSEIRTDAQGAQTGFCVFSDGSECDEWAFMRGECKPGDSTGAGGSTVGGGVGIANPASVFCVEQGGTSEIRTDAQGGQSGYCVFQGGSECEEWAFMRSECTP